MALYPAEATKLHSSGKLDAAYEMRNTVGVFFDSKKTRIKIVMVGGVGKKKVCSVDDCLNTVDA